MNDELFKIIFGEFTLIELLGYVWFFIIGYIVYGLMETTGRDVDSKHTPKKWSWKFWMYDNWKRYVTTILCTYILFRFYNEISGHPFGYFDAVCLGLIGDGVAVTIKKRVKSLGVDREKLMQQMNDDNHQPENMDDINVNPNEIG